MGICKSRGLNPFAKDCYLMKYSQNEGAAIITSIDYFRKRAKAQKDCKGWKKGIIVERNGQVTYTEGLMLESDTLLGGWFKAKPENWDEPFLLEVNLKGYIKYKKDGTITRFWQKENQPSQIMKVAESQGLRTVWPDEFQQLYTQEELGEADTFATIGEILTSEDNAESLIEKFTNSIPKGSNQEHLNTFLQKALELDDESETIDDIKVQAAKQLDTFWKQFEKWEKSQKPESSLSEKEQAIRAGFINIKKPENLRGTEKLLRNEMMNWSNSLQKEWLDKWLRIVGEPYVFIEPEPEESVVKNQGSEKQENTPQKEPTSTTIEETEKRILALIPQAKRDSEGKIAIPCPNKNGNYIYVSSCKHCDERVGCPSWEEYDKAMAEFKE